MNVEKAIDFADIITQMMQRGASDLHITAGAPPTVREKGVPETEIDELFRKERVWNTKLLGTSSHAGRVGAFEGAGYEAKGLYRPQADCMMFTRDDVGFCRVCSRAIEMVIDQYSK